MSRAFVRESDFDSLPDLPPPASPLPPGAKNYLTAGGAARLGAELKRRLDRERPPLAAAAPEDIDAKRELQVLDQRIRYLQNSLSTAEIVAPPADPAATEPVRFGATVTTREGNGSETRYRIVGVDETDLDRNWISWLSPLAQSLLNAHLGQHVVLKTPRGATELEITGVTYEPDAGSK